MRNLIAMFSAVLFTAALGLADDAAKPPRIVAIPVDGANAGCCTSAVKEALEGLPGVVSVKMEPADGGRLAFVTLDEKAELRLSAVTQALEEAAKDMATMMGAGLRYVVNRDRLAIGEGSLLIVAAGADGKPLAGVAGLARADVEAADDAVGLRLHLAPKGVVALTPVATAMERAGTKVSDLVLAPNWSPETAAKSQPRPPQQPPKAGGGC